MKKQTLLIIIFLLICILSALLTGGINALADRKITEVKALAESSAQSNLTMKENMRTADSFSSVMDCTAGAKYANVSAYVAFMGENSFTPDQLTVINRILDKGTTVQSLAQVYDFWLTTAEPFSIIEEICALEDVYFSEYWYENAFNELTENKHGVLDRDGIREYKDKGIPADIILAANTLCRKGVYTITEILDKVADGADIEDIACEIYELESLPEADTSYEKIKLVTKAKKLNISEISTISSHAQTNALNNAQTAYTDAISEKISAEVKRLNLVREVEDYDAVENTGLPISTINALMNKGFTAAEIALIPDMDTDDVFKAAKMAREVLKNE